MAKKDQKTIKQINKKIQVPSGVPDLGLETSSISEVLNINLADPEVKIPGIRLNIGSGADYKPGFLNVDKYDHSADANWDIVSLPLCDNSVAQIVCCSVLEHLPQAEVPKILQEWHRVLKLRGDLVLTVPDIVNACERIIKDPEDDWAISRMFGTQATEGQFHKSAYTPKRLFKYLGAAGFIEIGIAYFDEPNGVRHMYARAQK